MANTHVDIDLDFIMEPPTYTISENQGFQFVRNVRTQHNFGVILQTFKTVSTGEHYTYINSFSDLLFYGNLVVGKFS